MRMKLFIILVSCFIVNLWPGISSAELRGLSLLLPLPPPVTKVPNSSVEGDDTGDSSLIVQRLYMIDRNQLNEISNDLSAHLKAMATAFDQMIDDTNVGDHKENLDNSDLIGDDELPKLSFFERSKDYVRRTIAPAKEYYDLVRRYRAWYRDYNSLIQTICDHQAIPDCNQNPPVRSALDALQIEYAKLDQTLYEQAVNCKRSRGRKRTRASIEEEARGVEKSDFLLKALKMLIDRLEENLNHIQSNGFMNEKDEMDELLLKMGKEDQDEYTRVAIERAKRILAKKARRVALREIRHLFKFVLLNSLAHQVKNRDRSLEDPDDVMSYVEPIILLLGDVDTPIIVTYLRDLRFRLALALVKHLSSARLCSG